MNNFFKFSSKSFSRFASSQSSKASYSTFKSFVNQLPNQTKNSFQKAKR